MVIEGAAADARALEDLLGRDPVVVALDEEVVGGLDQRLPRALTRPPPPWLNFLHDFCVYYRLTVCNPNEEDE